MISTSPQPAAAWAGSLRMSVDWWPCSNGPPESDAKSRWGSGGDLGGRPGKGEDDRGTEGRGASGRIARGCLRDVGIPRVSPGLLSLASGDIVEAVPYAQARSSLRSRRIRR